MKKIFGYGSLINENDLKRTVPKAINILPAKLYGYRREFNIVSTYRFDPKTSLPICVLNLEKSSSSDFVNGISFDMEDLSFDDLLEREKAYSLEKTIIYDYYDEEKYYQAHFFVSMNHQPYPYLLDSKLQLYYLSICIEGCRKYGQGFLDEFKRTTHFFGIDSYQYNSLIWEKINIV